LWDTQDGSELGAPLQVANGQVQAISFSPDSRLFAASTVRRPCGTFEPASVLGTRSPSSRGRSPSRDSRPAGIWWSPTSRTRRSGPECARLGAVRVPSRRPRPHPSRVERPSPRPSLPACLLAVAADFPCTPPVAIASSSSFVVIERTELTAEDMRAVIAVAAYEARWYGAAEQLARRPDGLDGRSRPGSSSSGCSATASSPPTVTGSCSPSER
jgi:hypothetical protein